MPIDTKIRKLLIGGTEEDFKVGVALAAKKNIVREGLYAFEDVELWEKKMQLEKVRYIQENHTTAVVSGSIALFLHGGRCGRWEHKYFQPDIDLIIPFYQNLTDKRIKVHKDFGSGCDFDQYLIMDETIKIDVLIDNKQKYDLVTYNNFTYKVGLPLDILEAKIRYARQGGVKHTDDIYDMIGKSTFGAYLHKVNSSNKDMPI